MHAVVFRFRTELRRRWRAWLLLAVLVGAVAGSSLGLLAGSRRTGSALDRFERAQRAYDIGAVASCKDRAPSDCHNEIGRLPAVESSTTLSSFPASIETLDGRSIQPDSMDACYSGPGDVETLFDSSGRFGTTINRSRFVAGRAARPEAADEVVISQETAERLHLGPGDQLQVRLFGGADCLDDNTKWRAPQRVRIVGVQLRPGEVRPPSGLYFQWIDVTPAFVRRAGDVPDRADYLVVRLEPGASPAALRAQAHRAGYELEVVVSQAETARTVERAIRPNEVSLGILGLLMVLAGLIVLGQILARQVVAESRDDATLAALGMGSGDRIALAAVRGSAIGLVTAVVAVAAAVIVSAMMPIGLARRVEPAPGVSLDFLVVGLGALLTLVFVAGVSTATAARLALRRERRARVKPAALAGFAAHMGFSPSAVSGVRFAVERGSGSTAVPVASSFAGLTIAVVAVIGALTFGAGLTHLRETPRLSGWNWDAVLPYPEVDEQASTVHVQERVRARDVLVARGTTEVAMGTVWSQFPQGRDLQLGPDHMNVGGFVAFDGTARVGPSVISGRKPVAWDEILVGPRTIEALGLQVGDRVEAVGQAGTWEEPGEETSVRMTIVGTGLAPMTESLGRGAVITLEGLKRLNPQAIEQALYVRLEPGQKPERALATFRDSFPVALRETITPFQFETLPDAVLNLELIGSVPALFALIMGLMAAAVLAHVLAVAARARRRDLAILRALGFSRGQTVRTIAWQSTIYASGALVLGIPLGVVLGRAVWRAYAANLGAVPQAVVPIAACVAVTVATLALAIGLSIVPGLRVARTRPAELLHTE